MKKRYGRWLLTGLLAVSLLLTGCHGRRAPEDFCMPENFDPDAGTYNLVFWAKNDTNKDQTAVYDKAIRDFEALYPNIHIQMRLYTDYGRIYDDVITNLQTGTTPNICISYPDHIATYMTGTGAIVPITELAADPEYGLGGAALRFDAPTLDEIDPSFLEECRIKGELIALPYMRSTECCYVNRDLVEALGYTLPDILTWDFVWEVSEAAAATRGADGIFSLNKQQVLLPFIYKSTDNMLIQYLRQAGAPYSTSEGEVLLFNEQTRDFLSEIAIHTASGAFSTFKISGYPGNFLNAGQCIFAVDSTAGAAWMGHQAPHVDISPDRIVPFTLEVRPIPQLDPDHPVMISQGPSLCLFNKPDPQEVLASWLFLQFLLTDDIQIGYAQTEGYVPVTTRARSNPVYTDYLDSAGEDLTLHYQTKLDATDLLLAHTQDTFVTPVFNGSASVRNAAGTLIENTAKSVRRGAVIDDAYWSKLFSEVQSLYRLDSLSGVTLSDAAGTDTPLPAVSAGLLITLGLIWLCILIFFLREKLLPHNKT